LLARRPGCRERKLPSEREKTVLRNTFLDRGLGLPSAREEGKRRGPRIQLGWDGTRPSAKERGGLNAEIPHQKRARGKRNPRREKNFPEIRPFYSRGDVPLPGKKKKKTTQTLQKSYSQGLGAAKYLNNREPHWPSAHPFKGGYRSQTKINGEKGGGRSLAAPENHFSSLLKGRAPRPRG